MDGFLLNSGSSYDDPWWCPDSRPSMTRGHRRSIKHLTFLPWNHYNMDVWTPFDFGVDNRWTFGSVSGPLWGPQRSQGRSVFLNWKPYNMGVYGLLLTSRLTWWTGICFSNDFWGDFYPSEKQFTPDQCCSAVAYCACGPSAFDLSPLWLLGFRGVHRQPYYKGLWQKWKKGPPHTLNVHWVPSQL